MQYLGMIHHSIEVQLMYLMNIHNDQSVEWL